ncbi:disease resistance-like protein DSC1 [Vicia villosa]|uniref:disease resistance-like protein DSC1 n=1 Tax=Vicia villosa TaxID=3911 RepID=UPI00273B8920|nr:disease resistance-like protein DSC1 [Vicia villosa]
MNSQSSLQLFSLNAFDKVLPELGYVELSKRAIDYAQGNPLALKILGSLLCCKNEIEWNCALDKLKETPNTEIDRILRWSYDELDDKEKSIFLDIALFFKGHKRDMITKILNECGLYAEIGMRRLLDKALIRVDFQNCIQMHDLIHEMGKQVVREECLKHPGQRSRLYDRKEVCDVLKNNRGTEIVEAIFLDATECTHINLSPKAFAKMPNLRLLAIRDHKEIKSIRLPSGLALLPENLRYFLWDGYPCNSLPPSFCPEMLVKFSLRDSHLEKLWNGILNLPNLEILDLSYSKKLIQCPNVSGSPNLKEVMLTGCASLPEVDSSIFLLQKLERLLMIQCTSLKTLSSNTCSPALLDFDATYCINLQELSVPFASVDCLSSLALPKWCVNELPSSILHFKNLESFTYPISDSLVDLPENFAISICLVGESLLKGERDLSITLRKLLPSPAFLSVKDLFIDHVSILSEIPDNISLLSSLESLSLAGIAIRSLPETLKYLPRLKRLDVFHCNMLQSIPALSQFIPYFIVWECESLEEVFSSTNEPSDKPKRGFMLLNCIELDPHSYRTLLKDAIAGIKLGARLNSENKDTSLDDDDDDDDDDNDIIEYFLPAMPGMKIVSSYHSTQASFTLEVPPNLLGFAYYLVLSQGNVGSGVDFGCECCLDNSSGERFYITSFKRTDFPSTLSVYDDNSMYMMSNHLILWYDPARCKQIMEAVEEISTRCYNPKLTFRFFIDERLYNEVMIVECGFHWINMHSSDKEYDVFISFRGEDTRKNFTAQLHQALTDKNINTYIDYSLNKGDEVGVGPSLAKAIQGSHVSIVVFSENYATSKWCLDELLHILHCRELHGQVVIPVFCGVDPSHVLHQKESYQIAFAKYQREFANNGKSHLDKVSEWKDALTLAANISGWDSTKYSDNYQVIQYVVEDVLQKLSLMYPNELKNHVKVDENNEHIELLLKTTPIFGIWGMSGIGKTTMAKQMFAKNFAHYDNVCFLENVSEQSKKFGQLYVRNKLLSELLKQEITASDVHGQGTFTKRRLSGKKSFIVLDDVDDAMQLDDLCGELDDLGHNSRVIITTRNKDILSGRIDEIYEVTPWELKDSLKLFSLGAFRQSHPKKGYERISERAVEYAGGVPLALKVLGSHFYSRKPEFWESELNYYENKGEAFPYIQNMLKLSYNGLSWQEKEMFLDIAFFFKDENKDFVTRILNAFGFNATNGVEILEDRALISISNSNRIQIQGLLQKMAFGIVQQEYNDRGKRSRLKEAKDICGVLGNNKGIDAVEGVLFDLSQKLDLEVQAYTFKLMTKLRFLKFHVPKGKKKLANVHLPINIKPFFTKLTYLEWNGYPLKFLPQPFCAEQLIQICLPHSNIEHLWFGIQELVNLEVVDLSESKQLINLPDLSRASKLRQLLLSGCENLCEVRASAFSKDTLDTLLLDGCTKLQSLMGEKHLKSLENFSVKDCSCIKEFSLSSDSIKKLDLSSTGIEILHPSVGGMNRLYSLNLEGLNLTILPIELSHLRSLTELRVSECSAVTKSKLETIFYGLGSLTLLHLKYCCNLFELPVNISSLSSLHELRLDGSSLEELPASIKDLSELKVQSLDNCSKLRCLPELPSSIKEFQADNCTSLKTVSTLKTFSVNMIGQKKYISFKNSIKMELDGPSIARIAEDAMFTMKSAAFHNVLVREYGDQTHGYNYNSAEVCLPGCRVPRQFKHRSTIYSSITIDVSNSVGFIFSVVVTPSNITQKHGYFVGIVCQCYSEDGGRKVGPKSKWNHNAITNLNMDHVFVWYDPYHSDSILRRNERKVSFKFCITTYTSSRRELGGLLSIKECGVCPIYYSESKRVLGTGNIDKGLELDLYQQIEFERSVEGYGKEERIDTESNEIGDDKEGTDIQNQESDCLTVSNDTAHDNHQEKENLEDDDNSKEMIKSEILHNSTSLKSGDETESSSNKRKQFEKEEDSTGGSSDVELSMSKEIKRSSPHVNVDSIQIFDTPNVIAHHVNYDSNENGSSCGDDVQFQDGLESFSSTNDILDNSDMQKPCEDVPESRKDLQIVYAEKPLQKTNCKFVCGLSFLILAIAMPLLWINSQEEAHFLVPT